MVFDESFVGAAGCRIRRRRGGEGPPLLYLHGANGAATVPPFLFELAERFDVLVPEHPGFGQSDEPSWLEDIHDLAYFYLDLLDQLGLPRLHVIGSSIGGWLALELALREPLRLHSLVLIGSAGIRIPEAQPGDIFLWSPEQLAANTYFDSKLAEQALALPVDADVTLKNRHTTARLAWSPRLHDPALHKWLHRLKMPVQIAWGEQDRVMPPAYAHAFKRLLPHADLQLFAECGHLPQLECPERFVAAALRFFDSGAAR